MSWKQVWTGSIWVAEQAVQADGSVYERVRRAPGSRIIITQNGKILLSKEKRQELGGKVDYRLPGGKVFDTQAEYAAFLASGKDITEASRTSVAKEALEEVGVVAKEDELELYGVDVLGATASWDLYYWTCEQFSLHEKGAQFHGTEAAEIEGSEWVSLADAAKIALDPSQFSESRSARMLLSYVSEKGVNI